MRRLKLLRHPEREQQSWIINAILKKIARESSVQDTSLKKYLGLKLDENLIKKLESKLAEINKSIPGFSKKQWLLSAIEEKLEVEKELLKKAISISPKKFKKKQNSDY